MSASRRHVNEAGRLTAGDGRALDAVRVTGAAGRSDSAISCFVRSTGWRWFAAVGADSEPGPSKQDGSSVCADCGCCSPA